MSEVKPDIKIFVSHRIDQDSETIDNPLFVNVRCGAVYDTRENVSMLGEERKLLRTNGSILGMEKCEGGLLWTVSL